MVRGNIEKYTNPWPKIFNSLELRAAHLHDDYIAFFIVKGYHAKRKSDVSAEGNFLAYCLKHLSKQSYSSSLSICPGNGYNRCMHKPEA